MAWGQIQLRNRSRRVVFSGEASPAPGDGSIAKQGIYGGTSVSINNNSGDFLPWVYSSGDALLDLSAPTFPSVVAAGTYAVTVGVVGDALTADGFAQMQGTTPIATFGATSLHPDKGFSVSYIATLGAGDGIAVALENDDGAQARSFNIDYALVVKLA